MNNKKPVVIGLAGVVGAGLAIVWYLHRPVAPDEIAARTAIGVVNPDRASAGLTTKPAPQLSTETFVPPPSMGTGSYTDPAVAKNAAGKKTSKKDSNAR